MSESKIIQLPGITSYGERETLFKVVLRGQQFDYLMQGNEEAIYKMFVSAMQYDERAARCIISAVIVFAYEKKIPLTDLMKHSYLTKNK